MITTCVKSLLKRQVTCEICYTNSSNYFNDSPFYSLPPAPANPMENNKNNLYPLLPKTDIYPTKKHAVPSWPIFKIPSSSLLFFLFVNLISFPNPWSLLLVTVWSVLSCIPGSLWLHLFLFIRTPLSVSLSCSSSLVCLLSCPPWLRCFSLSSNIFLICAGHPISVLTSVPSVSQ